MTKDRVHTLLELETYNLIVDWDHDGDPLYGLVVREPTDEYEASMCIWLEPYEIRQMAEATAEHRRATRPDRP